MTKTTRYSSSLAHSGDCCFFASCAFIFLLVLLPQDLLMFNYMFISTSRPNLIQSKASLPYTLPRTALSNITVFSNALFLRRSYLLSAMFLLCKSLQLCSWRAFAKERWHNILYIFLWLPKTGKFSAAEALSQ